MHTVFCILVFLFIFQNAIAREGFQGLFSPAAFTVQYAGSTGFITLGFSRITGGDKIELGLLYGKVPRSLGGVNRSLTFKVTCNPFQWRIAGKLRAEPFQTGIFISQNFGEHLKQSWGNNYPEGYYWWQRSLRFHYFIGSQLSYKMEKKTFDRVSCYVEANTNDLYLYSYFPNRRSLDLYDIFFLGAGLKLYMK